MIPHPDTHPPVHPADEELIETFIDYSATYGPRIGAGEPSGGERWDRSKEHAIADLWSDEGVNDFRPTII